jgi:cellulose synthase operon protein C
MKHFLFNDKFLDVKRVAAALAMSVALSTVAGCTPPAEKAKAFYESGQKYLEQKDYVKAALEFRNALKVKQDYADAWFGMAQVEEQEKNWNVVAGDLNKVLELDPKHNKARMALSRLYMLSGNFAEALRQVNLALEVTPKDPAMIAMRAAVLLKLDKNSEAVVEANNALAIDAGNVDAIMVLAAERLLSNDFAGTQKFLDRGLETSPNALGLQLFALSLYQKTEDAKAQESTLRRIIEIDPSQSNYRKALVSFLINLNRYDDAERELRALAKSKPQDVEANLDLVKFLASFPGKGPDVAVAELKRLINAGNSASAYKSSLAQLYFELGRNDESTALLKDVISKEGINEAGIAARLDLSGKFILGKKLDEAEGLVSEALKNDARNVEGLRQKAAIDLERGKLDDASTVLRQALGEAPGNPLLYQMMAAVNERNGAVELADKSMSDAFRVSKYNPKMGLDYARFLIRRGKSEHAESLLTDILGIAPNNVEVLSLLADLKLRRQDWQGAQDLAEAIKKAPGNSAISGQISAAALLGQNKLEDSIHALLEANASSPNRPETKFALVKAYLKVQKFAEAEDFLKTVLTAEPNNADARVYLGVVQMNTKRPDEAKSSFEAAISAQPTNPVGYRALADFHARDGHIDLAMESLKNGLSKAPKNMDLRFALATLYQSKGDIDSAIKTYEDMLVDQPGSMLAANNYASLVSDFRTDAASIDKAATAAAVLRGSPISQFKDTLGWILYLRGQYKEALDLLKQSTADLPDMALTNYHLGKAYIATGDKKSATESYQRGLKVARNDQERQLIEIAIRDIDIPVTVKKP